VVAQWLERSSVAAGWVCIDSGDNDLHRFWRYLLLAAGQAVPSLAGGALSVIDAAGSDVLRDVLPVFVNDVAGSGADVVIVLDDYHLVTNPVVHDALATVLAHPPLGLHLLVLTRSDPPLPLSRLRVRGTMVEIRTDQLHFTVPEATELLNDRFGLALAYLGISFPVYWVGLLLILLFAVTLHWLPPSGFGGLRYLILPALALGMRSVAFLARMTRSAMLDALGADYVRTARAKGLRERVVVARHALRNALIPIITVLGLDFGAYLTGSILTETIFSWPGLGRYVVNAIARRDLPAIQGSVLFLSAVFVLVNLLTDLAYAKADPRVTYA